MEEIFYWFRQLNQRLLKIFLEIQHKTLITLVEHRILRKTALLRIKHVFNVKTEDIN